MPGFDYQKMVQDALRGVMAAALKQAAEQGLGDEHYFYISYRTDHPEVVMPDFLREQYPETIDIVLQHQFWDLEVNEESFSVTLAFGGKKHWLYVPFAAIDGFADPSVNFVLQFHAGEIAAEEAPDANEAVDGEEGPPSEEEGDASGGSVVDFDAFRRRT